MTKEQLKQATIHSIDEHRETIFKIKDQIYANPEFGYKEVKTTAAVADFMEKELKLNAEKNLAITGCRARTNLHKEGPRIVVMGELDGISCKEHKDANEIGASHTCGHNLQIAGMLGAAVGLIKSGAINELEGKIDFLATPAEEFIELEYRAELKTEGKLTYFGGKQELIKRGYLDDVDMAMMFHSFDLGENKALIGPESNGFIGKRIHFIGKESHAGSAPYDGINALNAAMLAINNVNALRETFKEEDRVRFHPIITKGGDIVNVVPADVIMESYVRASSLEALTDQNAKINRAIKAAAMAVGAEVEITEMPGYLPIIKPGKMGTLLKDNLEQLGLKGKITDSDDFSGSLDFGDVSHLMPAIHPMIGGIKGALHTRTFEVTDPELACITPAKALAMTIIDLLYDNAAAAKDILKNFVPAMTKDEYLKFQENNDQTISFSGRDL